VSRRKDQQAADDYIAMFDYLREYGIQLLFLVALGALLVRAMLKTGGGGG